MQTAETPGMTILIVDDAEDSRALLMTLLKRGGHQSVRAVSSAAEAFDCLGLQRDGGQAAEFEVDCILMDHEMPAMSGIEATRHLKSFEAMHDTPVVMVTAKSDDDALQAAFDAGAVDYITKPVKRVELLARLRSVLRLKEEMDERKAHARALEELAVKLEAANRELEKLSFLDGLTGIANRRRFSEFVEREWERGARDLTPLSVIMIDIDHFKHFNDSAGHEAGDEILRRVARALEENIARPADLAARYGGEEFVCVLPGTDLAGGKLVAEKLRIAIEALLIPHPQSPVSEHVTISLGVAAAVAGLDHSAAELVARADHALYQAKRAGRNRVHADKAAPLHDSTGAPPGD